MYVEFYVAIYVFICSPLHCHLQNVSTELLLMTVVS